MRRVPAAALACAALAAVLAGCVAIPKKTSSLKVSPAFAQKSPKRVAVLLFANDALDLNAPPMLRQMAWDHMRQRGYDVLTLEDTDANLHQLGYSDGGQIKETAAVDLAKSMGVDGLLFGTLESFVNTDLGFAMRKAVRVRLALLAAQDGEVLWEDTEQEQQFKVRVDQKEAQREAMISLGEKAVANMRRKPLYEQSIIVMDKLFATLPGR